MKTLNYNSHHLQIVLFLLIVFTNSVSSQSIKPPNLRSDGNVSTAKIQTESGVQFFAPNEGFLHGANRTKVFGQNKSTTLWDNNRRTDCYEKSIRIMAQMPVLKEFESLDTAQNLMSQLSDNSEYLGFTAKAFNALQSNYIKGNSLKDVLNNKISQVLKKLNPKSIGGVKIPCTNLQQLGNYLESLAITAQVADFALGAALQEALAGDVALGRLDRIEQILNEINKSAGNHIDNAIYNAIKKARVNLTRSEDYWGALITELSDRKNELVKIGLSIGIKVAKKDAVKLLAKYYANKSVFGSKALTTKLAATKAASVAGLWAFSLMATYETIDSLLEQHKKAQVSVTSSTLGFLLGELIKDKSIDEERVLWSLKLQADYSYYDQMVQVASGKLQDFYDLLTPGQPYKDAKLHYTDLKDKVKQLLLGVQFTSESGEVTLGFILDSSGSMSSNDPQGIRKIATEIILKQLSGREKVFLVDFDDRAVWLNPQSWQSWNFNVLKQALRRVDSDGGTNIGSGISKMREALTNRMSNQSNTGILLLTDGVGSYNNEAEWFTKNNIPIHTISLVGKANETLLRDIASATNGRYIKAANENDIVSAFNQFFTQLSGRSTICTHHSHISQDEKMTYEFYVDSNMDFCSAMCVWTGSKIGLKLIAPGGKIYTSTGAGMWSLGDRYVSVNINKPEAGKWQAEFTGLQIPAGGEPFSFEVNGEAPLKIDLIDSSTQPGIMALNLNLGRAAATVAEISPQISVITPKNDTLDISDRFNNNSFNFFANAGKGSYRFEVDLKGKYITGQPFQRHLSTTVLVGDYVPVNIAPIKQIIGNYVKTNLGLKVGNRSGVMCVIYPAGGSSQNKIATGYVTFVNDLECTVEIQRYLTPAPPKVGDMVELDLAQWTNDSR